MQRPLKRVADNGLGNGMFRVCGLAAGLLSSVSVLALTTVQSLSEEPVQLEKIVVVDAAKTDTEKLESDVDVTRAEIEQLQPADLKQLLLTTPSVAVAGGAAASQKLYVHGIDEAKLNVSVDGARQKNNVWHHNGTVGINPIFLKSLEINEGVAPADDGPGALGGSVKYETVDATDLLREGQTLGGLAIVGYDTNSETVTVTGAGYQAIGGFEILGMVTRGSGQNYSDGDGAEMRGTGTDLWNGLGKFAFESLDGHRIEVTGEYYRDFGLRLLRTNMALPGDSLNENLYERLTTTVRYTAENADGNLDPEVLFYYNFNKLQRPNDNGFTSPSGAFNSDVQSFGGHAQNTFHLGMGDVTVGADFYNDHTLIERFHDTDPRFSRTGDVSENVTNVGAYVQARLEPMDKVIVSTGLRADFQSYRAVDDQTFDHFGLSPNINLGYRLTDEVTLNAGYSYVFGGLEQAEAALFHAWDYAYADDLKPTYAHNAKIGIEYGLGGLSLSANLFYIKQINPLAYDYSPTPFERINGDPLISQGIDLAARYDWGHAYVHAAFTYADVQWGERIALPGDSNVGVPVGSILSLSAAYLFEEHRVTVGANAEIAFEYASSDLAANGYQGPLPGYEVVNLFAEWKPEYNETDLTLRGEINNLFDETYYSRGSYSPTARVTPVNSPGRSFNFSLTAKF